VKVLTSLTRSTPGDGGVWSDLAAAYLARAEQSGRSADRPRALESALQARDLGPRSPETLVNLALALEGMHLMDEARAVWQDAHANEGSAEWQADIAALRGRSGLTAALDRGGFLESLSRAAERGDLTEIERLARESSEGVRFWFNSRGLAAAEDQAGRDALARIRPALNRSLEDPDIPDSIDQVLALPARSAPALTLLSEVATLHHGNRWGEAEAPLARLRERGPLPRNLDRWRDLYEAVTHLQNGDTARARAGFDALIANTPDAAQPFLKGVAHYRRSVVASSGGQPDLAIRHRAEAARLFTLAGEPAWVAFAGQQIGEVHGKLGLTEVDWDRRLDTLKYASRLFNERSALLAVTIVGDDLVRSQLPRSAAAVYRAAHERALAAKLKDSAADTALGVALALRTIDETAAREAALAASQMASGIEDPLLRARMSGEALRVRASLEPENEAPVSEALQWLGKRGSWGRQIPLMTAHGLALAASGRFDRAKKALYEAAALYEANRPRSLELSDAGSDQIRAAYAALAEIEARHKGDGAALADLARRYWMAAGNLRTAPASAVERGACALAMVPTSHTVLSWFTCGGTTRFRSEAIDARTRQDLVAAFVAARRAGLPAHDEGRRLSDLLLTAWEADIRNAGALTLTVAENLAGLPFAALPLSDGTLGAGVALTYSPMPGSIYKPSPGPWRSPLIVTAAPEGPECPRLPHAWAESSALSEKVGGRFLQNDEATIENVLASLPRADLFYFAGHALVNTSRPFDSSLVLVDASKRPSFLTIRRVLALDLRSLRLAVLAGCSTAGAGDVGSMSLAGAFLAAGAHSVLGTLWPVPDDAMGRLMPRFFEYLESEGTPARALLRLRNDASMAAPDRAVVDALAVSALALPPSTASITTH